MTEGGPFCPFFPCGRCCGRRGCTARWACGGAPRGLSCCPRRARAAPLALFLFPFSPFFYFFCLEEEAGSRGLPTIIIDSARVLARPLATSHRIAELKASLFFLGGRSTAGRSTATRGWTAPRPKKDISEANHASLFFCFEQVNCGEIHGDSGLDGPSAAPPPSIGLQARPGAAVGAPSGSSFLGGEGGGGGRGRGSVQYTNLALLPQI